MKRCSNCRAEKRMDEFRVKRDGRWYELAQCFACVSQAQREFHKQRRAKQKASER